MFSAEEPTVSKTTTAYNFVIEKCWYQLAKK